MKTAKELNAIKAEIESLRKKLAELTAKELAQVSGGSPYGPGFDEIVYASAPNITFDNSTENSGSPSEINGGIICNEDPLEFVTGGDGAVIY